MHKDDFVKYLKGTYLVNGNPLIPNYKTLDPANLKVKFEAHNIGATHYIPSNVGVVQVTTNSVKK